MYIPPAELPLEPWTDLSSIHTRKGVSGSPLTSEKWASVIGIVTAICGNILISFALNTQRYAHMRLSRDREEWELKQRRERRRNKNANGYGTAQAEVAEAREEANLKSDPSKYKLQEPHDSAETDPLIPSVRSLDRRTSSSSTERGPGLSPDDGEPKEKSYLKSPIWWLGISMMTIGEAGNFLAYGFAPASIVSPLGVVALISNCIIAPFLLHERFRWRDGLGVVIAVAGCVTIVMSASQSNPKLDPDRIWMYITNWEFELYLAITVALILALMWASNRFGDKSILIDLGLMALFGGYTALSTKGVASLLSNSVWRVVTFPITYLLVAVLIGTAIMQIKYVNRALQRFNSTQVIPTQFVLFTISVIVGSAILFRDFDRTTTEDASVFFGGCALTFLGVWFITSGRSDNSEEEEETDDEEDAVDLIDEEGQQPEIREREDMDNRRQSFIAGSSTETPLLKRSHTIDDNLFSTATTPASDSDPPQINKPPEMSPAKAAAIHDHSAAELHSKSRNGAPPMHATTSVPEVPTISGLAPSTPKTPLRRGTTTSGTNSPSKPSTPRPGPTPHPESSTTQRLLNRHSVAGLLPGPITSPLSSSLSAIVADTLRRGVDYDPRSSIRRPSFRKSKRRSQIDADAPPLKRHSIASGEMDFGSPETPAGGRVRSLSATLHDMFGSVAAKKGRAESRGSQADEGRGNGEGNGYTAANDER